MGDDPGAARADGGDPLIQLRGVTRTFGSGAAGFQALRGVDFDVAAGDFVAIMGPSGSGKSTMMNILGCLDVPTAGEFLFQGFHVEKLTRDERALLRRRYLGFVFQGFNLLARTNALENVELPLLYRGEKPRARRAAAMDALAQVGLADWWDHTPAELSGGQQQRVAIARAIVTAPQVLLADEPTGNLDTARSLEIMELLTRFNQTGITILMVTHEAEMAAFARTVAHVRDGLVEQSEARAMSMLGPTLVLALREIRRHVLRSFLTVLGIVIGVAAVVTMVTLGNGATAAVREQISGLGVNILQIRPGQGFGRGGGGPAPADFDMDDAVAIRDQIAGVVVVAPLSQSSGTAVRNAANWSTTVNGTTSDYFTAQQWATATGRTFTAAEEQAGKAVCVIGSTVQRNLFREEDPLGQRFRLRNLSCEVIGTLVTRGQGGFGNDQDDVVLMPIKTVQRRMTGNRNIRLMMVKVDPAYDMAAVTASIQSLLRERRNIRGAKQDDFNIFDTAQISQTLQGTTRILTSLLGAVAAVSLLVGGIGIMNIMLVSVTERTREIGIRLAIGAVGREVLLQFLVEAIVLACLGGIIGLLLALVASWALAPMLQVPFLFDVRINVVAFAFSALIGVIFGYFPARQAAQLNPIDALRHE